MKDLSHLQRMKPLRKQAGFLQFLPLIMGGLSLLGSKKAPKEQTTTQGGTSYSQQTNALPEQLQNAGNMALENAGRQFYQGQQLAPLNNLFMSAQNALTNLGTNQPGSVSGTNPGGMNTAPLSSIFANGGPSNSALTSSQFASGATINPYLNQVYDTAANATQNRLASEFARAGRGGDPAHQQARSQELQTLAAGIFGNGFEAERQRQYGAAESGISRALAQQEANLGRQYGAAESAVDRGLSQTEANLGRQFAATEANLGRQESGLDRQFAATENNLNRQLQTVPLMTGLGQFLQQDAQGRLNYPQDALNQYIAQLQGLSPLFPGTQTQITNQSGNVTQPLYNNPLSAFAGGAMLGGALQPMLAGIGGNRQQPSADNFINPYGNPYSPWAMNSMFG